MSINFRVHLTGSKNVELDFKTYGHSYVKLFEDSLVDAIPVSYTHLTLPTILLV